MWLTGQFQACLFFYEKVLSVKKHQNPKQQRQQFFTLLEDNARVKNAFVV